MPRRTAVIMAGGSGTRLWPLSRRGRPKQLLRIIDGKSLLRTAFDRLRGLLPAEEIFVIALAEHRAAIAAELPELPGRNFIGEPTGRDTAAAVALASAILHRRDAETVMGVFTADHVIRPVEAFRRVAAQGFETAERERDALVTFGVTPTSPHTGYGYVQRGDPIGPGVWRVRAFKEKPDAATARRYVESGEYYWNSGMFAWRTATVLEQLQAHLPATHKAAVRLAESWGTEAGAASAAEAYPGLQRISIDFAVMEKAPNVVVVEMPLEWMDVGSWTSLPAVAAADADGNVRTGGEFAGLAARNNVIVAEDDHLIAAIGVEDLVVVHSADATLICRKDQAERIKEVVEALRRTHGTRFD